MTEEERRRREIERLEREAKRSKCLACGKSVGPEDRCTDGNYLHRDCAYEKSMERRRV